MSVERLLVSTSQWFGVVTLAEPGNCRVDIIDAGRGAYTGVTWDRHGVLVVATQNHGVWHGNTPPGVGAEDRELLLRYEDDCYSEQKLLTRDTHAIHWDSRCGLLVCDTAYDQLVRFRRNGVDRIPLPRDDGGEIYRPPADYHHLNTVWVDRDANIWLIVRYDAPRRSEAWRMDVKWNVVEKRPTAFEAHNIAIHNDRLVTVGSWDSVLQLGDEAIPLEAGYPRGLAQLDHKIVVGGSARGSRDVRHHGDAQIIVYQTGCSLHRYPLPGAGQIYTIRSMREIDWAHQGDWGPPCPM